MGEQQFPLLLEDHFFLLVFDLQHHIFQGQSLHLSAKRFLRLQRHQRGLGWDDGVPQSLSHGVAVSGGAGCGVGRPSGGQHHRPGGIFAPLPHHQESPVLLGPELHGPVLENGYRSALEGAEQRVNDVGGAVRLGKDPVAPLHLQGHTQLLKEVLHPLRGRAGHGPVEKTAVARGAGEHLLHRAVVGYIAPSLAGDVQLAPYLLVALQQAHLSALVRGGKGRHHSGGSAANYQYICHTWSSWAF